MIRFFITITGLLLLFFASVQLSQGNVPSFLLSQKQDKKQTAGLVVDKQEQPKKPEVAPKEEKVSEKTVEKIQEKTTAEPIKKIEEKSVIPAVIPKKNTTSTPEPQTTTIAEESKKQVSLPKPIYNTKPAILDMGHLDATIVINLTNKARAANGLPPLYRMYKLDNSAKIKALDMLEKQYFAHDSPIGVTVENLAEEVAYEFVSLGENLAYGNFDTDQELVDGWMNSPGHRANILSKKYTEIGVFVVQGTFEGKEVWMAVQEFGKPRSACPQPDTATKEQVEMSNKKIEMLSDLINDKKKALSLKDPADPTYNQDVDEINSLVAEHNQLVAQVKAWIDAYNKSVVEFNICATT